MDDISLVETLRVRFLLKQKGVKLENSKADASAQNIRNKNWGFYSGERALTTLQDFTELLLMADEVTSLTGLHFQDLFPLFVRAMTDSHRRMYYMTQKLSYKLLAVFKNVPARSMWLHRAPMGGIQTSAVLPGPAILTGSGRSRGFRRFKFT